MNYLKNALLVCAIISASFQSFGQNTSEKGDVLINPSVTVGWYNYAYGFDLVSLVPPVALNFEVQLSPYVGIGMEGEYSMRKYKDVIFGSNLREHRYSYQGVYARGSFHYFDLIRDLVGDKMQGNGLEKLDLYLTVSSGYQWVTSKTSWPSASGEAHESRTFDSSIKFGYAAGIRYYFSKGFGVFAEGGRNGLGWIKAGLTLKF